MPGLPDSTTLRAAWKLHFVRRWADAVVVVSDYLKKALVKMKFPSDRITRIHNGTDINQFNIPGRGQFRNELGCQNGTKLVGMIANLRESKGYEYFIRAAHKVAAADGQVRFIAVGQIDKTIGENMRKLVHDSHLADRFLFLGFRRDVPTILRDLDLFVLSSITEGFSLATVEAMAAGKPVIATRSGGPEEIIDDGINGVLVPPADADALAHKIRELLDNPDRAEELARRGRAKAVSTFSIESMISEYQSLYDRLLKDGSTQ